MKRTTPSQSPFFTVKEQPNIIAQNTFTKVVTIYNENSCFQEESKCFWYRIDVQKKVRQILKNQTYIIKDSCYQNRPLPNLIFGKQKVNKKIVGQRSINSFDLNPINTLQLLFCDRCIKRRHAICTQVLANYCLA